MIATIRILFYGVAAALACLMAFVASYGHRTRRSGTELERKQSAAIHKKAAFLVVWFVPILAPILLLVVEPFLLKKQTGAVSFPLLIVHLGAIVSFGALSSMLYFRIPGIQPDLLPKDLKTRERLHRFLGYTCIGFCGVVIVTGLILTLRLSP